MAIRTEISDSCSAHLTPKLREIAMHCWPSAIVGRLDHFIHLHYRSQVRLSRKHTYNQHLLHWHGKHSYYITRCVFQLVPEADGNYCRNI